MEISYLWGGEGEERDGDDKNTLQERLQWPVKIKSYRHVLKLICNGDFLHKTKTGKAPE